MIDIVCESVCHHCIY